MIELPLKFREMKRTFEDPQVVQFDVNFIHICCCRKNAFQYLSLDSVTYNNTFLHQLNGKMGAVPWDSEKQYTVRLFVG